MKKILFLLLFLFTIASYGQAVFDEGIQITGNANSATATKVNVQEANGKVNTQTIKTGFNKNIGLGGSDVVGANTLLNQYSTTPVDWTATAFNSGQVVFYAGKQWIAKIATVAGDVPAVSSKWEEITFEALANKTVIVDATPTDGSNNAVSSNGVFDGLALKAPLASPSLTGTPTAPTATAGANTTQVATTAFVTNGIATADSQNVKLTGNQTISGQKSFSLTGKIDMQTNNAFPAISVTSLGSNGGSAVEFINNSSSPYSTALNLQTSLSGGVGNRTLDVSNVSPIGIGIVSSASNGGVSISSQSGNGDSYVSNITSGGTGRNYVGRNNGIETYSVDKIGNVIGNSYIKRSAPTTNLLLAGGGDIAQGTFALASSVHNPVTLGTANGLSLSNQVLSLGLASSSTTGALSGTDWNTFNNKQPTITGLTTNYLPKWNGSGFGNSGFYEDVTGLNINGGLKGITFDNPKIGAVVNSSGIIHKIDGVNKWSINVGAGDGSENYNIYSFDTSKKLVSYKTNGNIEFIPDGGRILINKTDDDLTNQLQVAGTISASPATTANQVPTWGQVQAFVPSFGSSESDATHKTVWNNGKGNTATNISFGEFALSSNSSTAFTTAIGHAAFGLLASGNGNTALGTSAGYNSNVGNLTIANQTILIGSQSKTLVNNATNEIVIGYNAVGAGSNTATLGNESITKTVLGGVIQKRALDTAPASATATGTTGEIRVTSTHIYVCTATNTWVRTALTTW